MEYDTHELRLIKVDNRFVPVLRSCARAILDMPKKTKKEKLRAKLHRLRYPQVTVDQRQTSALFTLPQSKTAVLPVTPAVTTEYRIIKHDLIKTVILAALILAIEFLLARWLPK